MGRKTARDGGAVATAIAGEIEATEAALRQSDSEAAQALAGRLAAAPYAQCDGAAYRSHSMERIDISSTPIRVDQSVSGLVSWRFSPDAVRSGRCNFESEARKSLILLGKRV